MQNNLYDCYFWHRSEGEGNFVAYTCAEHNFALFMYGHIPENVTLASVYLHSAFCKGLLQ